MAEARHLPSDDRADAPAQKSKKSVTPRWVDAILKGIAVFLGVIALLVFAPLIWGWTPVMGRSMEPTLSRIGSFVKTAQVETLKPGDIVRLKGQTLGHSVKRIMRITPQGLYVKGDNVDMSKDSSFGADDSHPIKEVAVPFSEVRGKVVRLWSPQRALRSRTPEGRFRNWVKFRFPPSQRLMSGKWVIVPQSDQVLVFCSPSTRPTKIKGELCSLFFKGRFSVWQEDERVDVDLERGTQTRTAFDIPTLPVRLEAVVKTQKTGIQSQSLLFDCSLPDRVQIVLDDGRKFIGSGMKLASIPELGGKPGTQIAFLGHPLPLSEGKAEVELRPL